MDIAAILVMWPRQFEDAFVPLFQGGSTWNLASIGIVVIEEKTFKNIESERFGQSHWMTLTFSTHKTSCIQLNVVDCIYQLWYQTTIGHHLNKLGTTWVPNAAYQLSR